MEMKFSIRILLTEVILGYIFWSIFHALPAMIWFYPLNELDITGYEAFVVVLFVPGLVGSSGFLTKVFKNSWALAGLRIIALLSLASFQAPSTLSRLIILTIGAGSIALILERSLCSNNKLQKAVTIWGLLLSFLCVLVSRIWYTTIVPTWSDVRSNNVVTALGAVATFERIISGFDNLCLSSTTKNESEKPDQWKWVKSGLGMGSLLYLMHAVFGEVSIVSRWVVGPYPNPGPSSFYGFYILMCLVIGGAIAVKYPFIATNWIWWLVGGCSFTVLYKLPTYYGFCGGAVLAVYAMSVFPLIFEIGSSAPSSRTITLAMVTYVAETLYSVWTIAYNFVPGGTVTRENSGYLVAAVVVLIGVALLSERNYKSQVKRHLLPELGPKFKTVINSVFFLILSVALLGFGNRWYPPSYNSKLLQTNSKEFSSLIWTYHFGYDNQGWPSFERSARLLRDTGADVITLLESDASKPYLGNNDIATWLSEHLEMYSDFGPSTRDHTWGSILLSKYPIVQSQHHLLPSPHGELAPAISATLNISGSLVDFVVTHMGNDRDTLDRKLQADYLSFLLKQSPNPIVFLGYVTSQPGSRDYVQLTQGGNMKDIDSTDQGRWCEYILYRDLIRLGYARISHGGLSDTELQIAKFRIPSNRNKFKDNDYIETDPENVEPSLKFNSVFGEYFEGHYWAREHHFHMNTPKYFLRKSTKE